MDEWSSFDTISKGKGIWLIDSKGNKIIDAVGSMWCNVWGHSNPRLIKAITTQSKKIQHSSLFNLTNEPAEKLAGNLIKISPGMNKVFFLPISFENCLIASTNGKLSMSPMVPPISQITKSSFLISLLINSFIRSVTLGITCTVFPNYFPLRSFFKTSLYICPVVILSDFFAEIPENLS